jgi:hypothetical protein
MIFYLHQRIRITDTKSPLFGSSGLVVQLRRSDNGAFVEMDRDLPAKFPRLFKIAARERWVIVLPHQAEQEDKTK